MAGTKKFFCSAYVIDATCFDEWFLLHMMTLSLNPNIVAFFETSVLKEVCFLRNLHNKTAVQIQKFKNKAIVHYTS